MDEEQIIKRIKDRTIFRQKIAIERDKFRSETYSTSYDRDDISLLIGESIDDYIEHRIQTDKVLEGILKDIQGNIAGINSALGDMDIREEIRDIFNNVAKP